MTGRLKWHCFLMCPQQRHESVTGFALRLWVSCLQIAGIRLPRQTIVHGAHVVRVLNVVRKPLCLAAIFSIVHSVERTTEAETQAMGAESLLQLMLALCVLAALYHRVHVPGCRFICATLVSLLLADWCSWYATVVATLLA